MIPRVIHHIWVGGPIPDHLNGYMQTWKRVHPGWTHRLWTEHELTWLENQRLFNDATRHAPGSEGQFRSDIARYEILRHCGGVYVDCDMEARQPFDNLLECDLFAGWETDGVWVNNAVIGCVPDHPVLTELIAGLPGNVERCRGKRPNIMTGPQFLTPLVRDRDDVTILPAEALYPYRWDQLDRQGEAFPNSLAVHHWNNARRRRAAR